MPHCGPLELFLGSILDAAKTAGRPVIARPAGDLVVELAVVEVHKARVDEAPAPTRVANLKLHRELRCAVRPSGCPTCNGTDAHANEHESDLAHGSLSHERAHR